MFRYIMKFFKMFILVIMTILLVILIINLTNFTIYYFSPSWLSKADIIDLERKASDGNCDASLALFYHYKKVFFKAKKEHKWIIETMSCQDKESGPKLINKGLSPLQIVTTFKYHGTFTGTIEGNTCAYIGIKLNYGFITRIEIYDKQRLLHTIDAEKNEELRMLGRKQKGFRINEDELTVTSCKKVEVLNYDMLPHPN